MQHQPQSRNNIISRHRPYLRNHILIRRARLRILSALARPLSRARPLARTHRHPTKHLPRLHRERLRIHITRRLHDPTKRLSRARRLFDLPRRCLSRAPRAQCRARTPRRIASHPGERPRERDEHDERGEYSHSPTPLASTHRARRRALAPTTGEWVHRFRAPKRRMSEHRPSSDPRVAVFWENACEALDARLATP